MDKENDKDTIVNSSRENSSERVKKNKKEKKSKKNKNRSDSIDKRKEKKKENKRRRSRSSIESKKEADKHGKIEPRLEKSIKKDKYLNYKDKDTNNEEKSKKRNIMRETKEKRSEKSIKPDDKYRERHIKPSRRRSLDKGSRDRYRQRSRHGSRDKDRKKRSSYDRNSRSRNKSRDRDYSRNGDRRNKRSYSRSRSIYNRRSRSDDKATLGEKIPTLDIKNKFEEIARFTSENAPVSTSDPSKRDRELYVANLPKGLTPNDVITLLNSALVAIEANLKPGDPILSAWINVDQNYALLEFRCPKETNNAFKLNGLKIIDKEIKIGRPKYEGEINNQQIKDMFPTLTGFEKDLNNPVINRSINSGNSYNNSAIAYQHSVTQTVLPTCSKLLVSNLPLNFDEEAVYKVLKFYGPIKSLEMIKDPITGNYSGQCHVEYENEKATSKALHYAMGINLQGNILYIKRSSGLVPTYSVTGGNIPTSLGILTNGLSTQQYMTAEDFVKFRENTSSKVICIRNMVNLKELEDEDEYDDLIYDVREECKCYGKVMDVKIPRPEAPGELVSGLGKIFVEFATRDGATFAKENLNGKSFNGRFVEVVFHPEDLWRKNQLD